MSGLLTLVYIRCILHFMTVSLSALSMFTIEYNPAVDLYDSMSQDMMNDVLRNYLELEICLIHTS